MKKTNKTDSSLSPQSAQPPKTNWLILILIAAVAAGLIAYFWIGQKSCSEKRANNVTAVSPSAPLSTSPAGEDETLAQQTLEDFFTYAGQKNYQAAAELLEPMPEGGEVATSWQNMPGLGTDNQLTDHGAILKVYCETFETCLPVKVLRSSQQPNAMYQFEVSFLNPDGSVYELGPCCGAEGPATTEFIYYVKKIDGQWKVITAPLYHP